MVFRRPRSIRQPPKIPNVNMPRLPTIPRNPPGFGTLDISLRARGMEGTESFREHRPAGDPPESWPGTEPEWAIKWALDTLGYTQDVDYFFEHNIGGIHHYFTQVDFMIPMLEIAIEVQGEFWHYGLGHERQERDQLRRLHIEGMGYRLIFIDEDDAVLRPVYLTEQALLGIDHSKMGNERKG